MTDLCKEINKFGKGIGNEARYRIIEALFSGPKTVTQLVKKVKSSQPAVSQHLKTLKESNLVSDSREGKEVYYSLNSEYTIKLLEKIIKDIKK